MPSVLFDRLDDGRRYAPEYRGGLSNHLPMALVALDAMGADGPRLCAFASDYARRLAARRRGDPLDDAFEAAFARRREAIDRDGIDAVLREALPRLMPGVGAAAFHGLIRTAYGVIAGHAGEIAAGLAYWETRFLPLLPALPEAGDEPDVGRWLASLCAALPPLVSTHSLIFERMAALAASPAFQQHAGRWAVDADTPRRLAAWSLDRYLASRDFTVLHMITSGHALRTLGPWLTRPREAWRWYAVAAAAGFASTEVSLTQQHERPEPPAWDALLERARASSNDHAIKLAHAARDEAQAWGDERRYRQAVALVLGDQVSPRPRG